MIRDAWDIGKTVVEYLFPNKAEQKKHKAKLAEMEMNGDLKELDKKFEFMKAEANSKHKWVAFARPAFLYVMYILILAAIPMGILSAFDLEVATNIQKGFQAWLSSIPRHLWDVFFGAYSVFMVKDSYDKKKLNESLDKMGMKHD